MDKLNPLKWQTGLLGLGLIISMQISVAQEKQTTEKKPTPGPTNTTVKEGKATPASQTNPADKEKMMAERKANQEMMLKIAKLNKEVQEAEKAGDGQKPEIVAKKAELKNLQDQRNVKMKADREKMMKEREANMPAQNPEEMMKMAKLNKEIQEATKKGEGETPETVAKKAELKKLQEERANRMRAEREKMMKEQKPATAPANQDSNKEKKEGK
jgi:hypothetical protein